MTKKRRDRAKEIAKEYGYLPYMIERYLSLWGEEDTLRFIAACDEPLKTAIRLNTLKSSPDETLSRLRDKGVELSEIPWLETG
ncbi:RNA methyltransferase, partial [Candidatus Thorarchaeota archaeon]